MAEVIVYTTNDCVECNIVKRMMTAYEIEFEIRNIMENNVYQEEVSSYGMLGVPVTVYRGRAVKGMNEELQKLVEKIQQDK